MQVAVSANAASKEQYLQNAKKYFRDNKYRETIIELKNAIKQDPEYIEARIFLGKVNQATGQPLAAEKEFLRAKKAGAKASQWVLPLGEAYIDMGRFDEILTQLKLGTDATPAELSKLSVLRGMAYAGLKKPEKALEEFVRAEQLDAKNAKAYLGQANIAAAKNELDKAEQLIEKAIAADSKLVDARIAMTTVKLKKKDVEAASVSIEKARELSPYNLRVLLAAADIYLLKGDFDKAQEDVDQVLKSHPSLPVANHVKAMVSYSQRDYEKAKIHADKVLRVSKNYLPAIRLLGAIALNKGELNQAQEMLTKAHSLEPKDIKILKALAETQYQAKEYVKARISLKKILDLAPKEAAALSMLGSVYLKLGETDKGKKYMEEAVKIDPDAAALKTNLALANIALGDTKGAIKALEEIGDGKESNKSDALLAMAYARDKEFERAFKIADRLVESGSNQSGAYNLRGEINIMAKNNEAAFTDFTKALELNSENLKALLNLARTNIIFGKYDLAKQQFQQVLDKRKNNLEAMLGMVKIARLNKDNLKIQTWLESINEVHPTHIASAGLLVTLYNGQKEQVKALAVARKLYQLYPKNADVIALYAEQLLKNGESKQAATYFKDAIAIAKDNAKLYIRLARAYAAYGANDKALKVINDGIKRLPKEIALYKAKVRVLMLIKKNDQALELAEELIKKWPQDPFGYDFAGDLYSEQSKYKKAEQLYRKTIALFDNPQTRIKLHKLFVLDGNNEEAINILREWYKKDTKSQQLNAVLALNLQQLGKSEEAIQVYEIMVANEPNNLVALNNLAWLYMEKGILDKAQQVGSRAYQVNPEMVAVLDTYGWILVKSGKIVEGEKLLQQAISKAPQDRDIRYHVAATLAQKGDTKGAIIELKQALSGGADFLSKKEAESLLKKLQ